MKVLNTGLLVLMSVCLVFGIGYTVAKDKHKATTIPANQGITIDGGGLVHPSNYGVKVTSDDTGSITIFIGPRGNAIFDVSGNITNITFSNWNFCGDPK